MAKGGKKSSQNYFFVERGSFSFKKLFPFCSRKGGRHLRKKSKDLVSKTLTPSRGKREVLNSAIQQGETKPLLYRQRLKRGRFPFHSGKEALNVPASRREKKKKGGNLGVSRGRPRSDLAYST